MAPTGVECQPAAWWRPAVVVGPAVLMPVSPRALVGAHLPRQPITLLCSAGSATGEEERARMGCLLRLRGLPFSCTEEDVLGFFEDSGQAVAVHLSTKNGGSGAWGAVGAPRRRGQARHGAPRASQVAPARLGAAEA